MPSINPAEGVPERLERFQFNYFICIIHQFIHVHQYNFPVLSHTNQTSFVIVNFSLDAVARRGKRKRSLSPSSEPVSKYGRSLMIFSGSQGSDVSKYSQFVGSDYSFSETVPNALENPALRQTLCFNQLLWTLKYLKFNPFKTSDEALEMIGTLCNGASEIATLSGYKV